MNSMDTGVKIKALREERALSTRAFSKRAGISTETLYSVEAGHRRPNLATLERIARALEVDLRDLL